MAQNIYDDKSFFDGYSQLPRQVRGLDGAPEWNSFRSLIPSVHGKRLLDLGSGYGWICRWAAENGAVLVDGIELSENMLSKAGEFPDYPNVTYTQADLEHTNEFPHGSYDIAVSSLTLHYLKNLPQLIVTVYKALNPGGCFVFSVEHPIYTSPRDPKFIEAADGHSIWLLDGYLSEGSRTTNWFAEGVVKYHRTIGTYIKLLLDAGFTLSAVDEWGPSLEQVKESPRWAENRERPMFLLMMAIKPHI